MQNNRRALIDLYRDNKVKKEDVEYVREFVEKNNNLPKYSDEMIATIIIASKHDLELAKNCCIEYVNTRNACDELFTNRNLSDPGIISQCKCVEFCISKERTVDNNAVMLARFIDTNPWNFEFQSAAKLFFMAMDTITYKNPPKGIIVLLDCRGFSLMHLTRISLGLFKKILSYIQDGMNIQLVTTQCLYVNWIADKLLKLLKPFIRAEIFKCILMHTSSVDMEWFYENQVPRRCLPFEYGGTDGTMKEKHVEILETIKEIQEFYKEEEKLREQNSDE